MKTRKPVVSGQFYPDEKEKLNSLLDEIYQKEKGNIDYSLAEKEITGAVVPHAGYMFSAYQAIHAIEIVKNHNREFDTFIILNPSHTGLGNEIAVDDNDMWETPLGKVKTDKDFINELSIPVSGIEESREHSGEVVLPLLQYFISYDFQIVPITITHQTFKNAYKVAEEIAKANKKIGKNIFIIASSDFSHFVHPKTGAKLDQMVIDKILSLDTKEVENTIKDNQISVCGYGPIMALMEYAGKITSTPKVSILKKGSSGDVIPSSEVVDYVSMIFYKE
jgi:AmmeMemoRadiSam system protein B